MGRLSYKQHKQRRREQDIIQAASQWINDHNYPDLNMDAIADAAGISKPTLYQHFRSKDELVARVMVSAMELLEAHLEALGSGSPRAQLEDVYRMLLREKYAPGGILAGLDNAQIVAVVRSNPAAAAVKGRVARLLHRLIEDGKTTGEIVREMPTELIIQAMFCTLGVLHGAYHDREADFWRANLDARIDTMAQWFVRSITLVSPDHLSA